MAVALAVLHPCEGQQQPVTIFLAIGKLTIDEFAILLDGTFLNLLFAGKEAIDNIGVGI